MGVYLAVIQFFFALSWTVYVAFLPQLAEQAGIGRQAVLYLLMLDQFVFVLSDYAMGVASDRVSRVVGRLGRMVVGLTLLSCAAFVALPFAAPAASPALLVALMVVWTVTSSALRAPPLVLIGRHAAKPLQPMLVGLSLMGLGVANAIAPYVGLQLRGVDPRLPFILSSVALVLATWGIVAAERAWVRPAASPVAERSPHALPGAMGFLFVAVLGALAFQVHAFLNSAPLYLRHATPAELPSLQPVFWIGFNLLMLPAGWAAKRWGGARVMVAACAAAALAAAGAQLAGSLPMLLAAQALAGAAWAALLMSAFAAALSFGHVGREGRLSGALSSVLAFAALCRMALLAAQGPGAASQGWVGWAPVAGWALAGLVLSMLARRRARA